MPVDTGTWRAEIGRNYTLLKSSKLAKSNIKIQAFIFHGHKSFSVIFTCFWLVAYNLLIKSKGLTPSLCIKISLAACISLSFCHRYLLLLAGDVHPNPGPVLDGKLKFGHWNLNSLLTRNKSKITLIEALQATEFFDLFAISESFLNDNTVKNDLEIHGFFKDPIRADCPHANNHPRGGVCLYYRENLPLKHRKYLQLLDETIVCELNLDRTKKIFFILSYWSPSQDTSQTSNYLKK